ncbi:hypothetical protein AAFF_G00302490 [Aldrovandia affinis]|uniref:NACHT, LRR and PYD domains-containing protein 12-like n=1 Tax=Aldrovandia affinis TaxID=143900 RepID=A0AAD7R936_9TELE|nr:hypothetical protein AAFF_G00302490 [Aldrovandia affinis]
MAGLILGILEELKKEEFKKFKLYLNETVLEGCEPIPRGRLEDRFETDVVTLMKDYYGDKMVNITQEILKKIPRNDLIERLENDLKITGTLNLHGGQGRAHGQVGGLEAQQQAQVPLRVDQGRRQGPWFFQPLLDWLWKTGVESRGGQTVMEQQQMHSSSSGVAGSDVSPERKRRVMEPGSETEQEGRPSRSKAASPLSSSHQGPDTGNKKLQSIEKKLKPSLVYEYKDTTEGFEDSGERTLLNSIYTEVNIIEGDSKGVNDEHEVCQIETASRKLRKQDTRIKCNNIFKLLPGQTITIRTVLTKGIAGIGKTISVQKFVLDWATGEANQDVDLMFVLPFRKLNLIKDQQYSLLGLLRVFHPQTRGIENVELDDYKLVFIFDGLDESKLPLDFQCNKILSDVKETSSVDVLLTNLIQGNLLPYALLWITSRPAAANQIPAECLHRLTEVQGFSDPQKEEYFKNRFRDQADLADRIFAQVKTSKSLYIMCYIPLFCWISASVLERPDIGEIPKTLTGVYTQYLLIQSNIKNKKHSNKNETETQKLLESNGKILLKLGQLAFQQLEKGNAVFYEDDLSKCGIDVTEASRSGVCTEIFKQEIAWRKKVFSFVHLSFQEYMAALHVLDSFTHNKFNALGSFLPFVPSEPSLHDLHKNAIDKALKSENGHLDLFLRFLLGLSLDSNQSLLQGLLQQTGSNSESIRKTIKYIKELDDEDHSPERYMNLLHCLSELNDDSLELEVQQYLSSGEEISLAHCSALAYMLLNSEKVLDEFDLSKYNTSDEGRRRLIPVVKHCRKAVLSGCHLTVESCEIVASALQSVSSPLRELDLSCNNLGDSGVELLYAALKSPNCKLQTLDLSCNNLGDSGVELLCAALKSPNCKLQTLDLSCNNLGDSGVVELLCAAGRLSKLHTLRLGQCNLTEGCCNALASVLRSHQSELRELELRDNDLQDSGVRALSAGLEDPHCKLQRLGLSGCGVTQRGCASLASALRSNPSHLRVLDLSYNHPGDSGGLEDPSCKLETLLVDHGGEIWIKPGLRKYACQLTLHPNTVNRELSLSEGDRKSRSVPGLAGRHPVLLQRLL